MNIKEINEAIKGVDTNLVSDGYHTFGELYEHRIMLFIALAKKLRREGWGAAIWRSTAHSDGSVWEGWFILGINQEKDEQMTYRLPMSKWKDTDFASTLDKAPEWDGHTSADVLARIGTLISEM